MKSYLVLFAISLFVIILSVFTTKLFTNQANSEKHLEVKLREIGHHLLLSTKDSTSRVLPIKKLEENTYSISFQHDFSFKVDTLIELFQQQFQSKANEGGYIVNVRDCAKNETVFAFELSEEEGNMAPCSGRELPVDCYVIEASFIDPPKTNYSWGLLLLIPLALFGFYMQKKTRKSDDLPPMDETKEFIPLGKFKFFPNENLLTIEDKRIELSAKEVKALLLFVSKINQNIDRNELMNEIWEKEGFVVISRNVDVLVSKLRKKLLDDPSIKILNVHGKGYKFIVE
jgi:hypothetical protein